MFSPLVVALFTVSGCLRQYTNVLTQQLFCSFECTITGPLSGVTSFLPPATWPGWRRFELTSAPFFHTNFVVNWLAKCRNLSRKKQFTVKEKFCSWFSELHSFVRNWQFYANRWRVPWMVESRLSNNRAYKRYRIPNKNYLCIKNLLLGWACCWYLNLYFILQLRSNNRYSRSDDVARPTIFRGSISTKFEKWLLPGAVWTLYGHRISTTRTPLNPKLRTWDVKVLSLIFSWTWLISVTIHNFLKINLRSLFIALVET